MSAISHHDLRKLILSEAVERHLDLIASAARDSRERGQQGQRRRGLLRRLPLLACVAAAVVVISLVGSVAGVPRIREAAGTPNVLPLLPATTASDVLRPAVLPSPALKPDLQGSLTVVLDAGHGGNSHGAEVSSGLMEKDINLDVGLRLRTLLEARGYEVLMTRQDDRDLPLEERVALANDRGADLFLSIHVNWMTQPDIRAIETFFRTETTTHPDSTQQQPNGSRQLAEAVQTELLHYLRSLNPKIRDRGVKSAPFAVLGDASMPAILTEVSCLSNEDDALLLGRASYRQYLAEALSAGIERFVESQRPRGRDA